MGLVQPIDVQKTGIELRKVWSNSQCLMEKEKIELCTVHERLYVSVARGELRGEGKQEQLGGPWNREPSEPKESLKAEWM